MLGKCSELLVNQFWYQRVLKFLVKAMKIIVTDVSLKLEIVASFSFRVFSRKIMSRFRFCVLINYGLHSRTFFSFVDEKMWLRCFGVQQARLAILGYLKFDRIRLKPVALGLVVNVCQMVSYFGFAH